MIALLRQAANPGETEGAQWARMRIHRVSTEMMMDLSASSKMIAEWGFLSMLRAEGRRSAQEFLERQAEDIGVKSSYDLDQLLDGV